jgi:hypothetical protein
MARIPANTAAHERPPPSTRTTRTSPARTASGLGVVGSVDVTAGVGPEAPSCVDRRVGSRVAYCVAPGGGLGLFVGWAKGLGGTSSHGPDVDPYAPTATAAQPARTPDLLDAAIAPGRHYRLLFIEHFPSGGFVTTSYPPAGSSSSESSINA